MPKLAQASPLPAQVLLGSVQLRGLLVVIVLVLKELQVLQQLESMHPSSVLVEN